MNFVYIWFEDAEPGTEFVITRYRDSSTNLRTQFQRIIRTAGVEPWPKLFQNLRSTRETELAEEFPMHVVCKWIGNSQPVAAKHYLQLTDEHFMRAINGDESAGARVTQNAAQKAHETAENGRKSKSGARAENVTSSSDCKSYPANARYLAPSKVPCVGLEPTTR